MKFGSFVLAMGLVAAAPAAANAATPWQVQPDGSITASGSLAFTYVSRSAGFTHNFGLYDVAHNPLFSIFSAPSQLPGATASYNTPGTYVFGLQVAQTGSLFFSGLVTTPGVDPLDPTQQLKFRYAYIDPYTTRIFIEDLKNFAQNSASCYISSNNQVTFTEPCDYNDMVVDVTNTPEPATMGLLAFGLVGLTGAGVLRRRKA